MTGASGATRPGGRLVGVDAARAVALVGMMATHLLPIDDGPAKPTLVGLLFDGRASALFAVLAGVGVALSTGGRARPANRRAHLAAGAGLVVRGVLVAAIGLVLGSLDPPPLVILAYYGLMSVVAVPFLRLPPWALAAGSVVFCAGAPVLSQLIRSGVADPEQVGVAELAHPGTLLTRLAVTGVYPVLTWTTYLLAGMAVGRLDLRRPAVGAALLLGGAVLTVAASALSASLLGPGGGAYRLGAQALAEHRYGTTPTSSWWWLAVDLPHSGAPLDLARTTGSALAVIGLMLLLARVARPVLWLPAAMGAVPLTLYALHVVATGAVESSPSTEVGVYVGHVVVAAAIGAALRLTGHRGPLEAAVAAATRRARTLVERGVARPVEERPSP